MTVMDIMVVLDWIKENWVWLLTVALPTAVAVWQKWDSGKKREALYILGRALESAGHEEAAREPGKKSLAKRKVGRAIIDPLVASDGAAKAIVRMVVDVDPKGKKIKDEMRKIFSSRIVNKEI